MKSLKPVRLAVDRCPVEHAAPRADRRAGAVLPEARKYLALLANEGALPVPRGRRLREIEAEIAARGTYHQTFEELSCGARLAWRNSIRCVGRKYWLSLATRDCRSLKTEEEIFEALVEHLRRSTNGGRIVPTITVFAQEEPGRPGPRIWNDQLVRYAGYRQADGTVLGDPSQIEFTEVVRGLGWRGGEGTSFDVLPLVIRIGDGKPRLFDIPRDAVLEVPISHPEHACVSGLGLRWHALPAIANMLFEAGGVRYPAAPFSGWYLGAEIAARNLADESRYNLLPAIARALGLDTRREESLWRDRALLELNVAVLHSFRKAGVRMVDHHTVTRHFVEFEDHERRQGRPAYAEWAWIVPPLSGSATPVFHRSYEGVELKPNFLYQPAPWRETYLSRTTSSTSPLETASAVGKEERGDMCR
jgi:nitric-oxide synthase